MTTQRPTISCCMMIKNEASNLRRCLESVACVVDEIVIVDTGSTDDSVSIAESYGARVFHSTWQNDFSFHRNESIGHASGDWVFIIDADEELVIEPGTVIREQLCQVPAEINAGRIVLQDIQDDAVAMTFHPEKFFRRGQIKYVNRKHNRPIFDGNIAALRGLTIRHYGYDGKQQTEGKKERDLALLLMMQKEQPDNRQILFWLSQTYGHYFGDAVKALEYCEQYIAVAHADIDFQPAAYVSCAEIARTCGDDEKSARYILDGLQRYPDDLDLHFLSTRNAVTNGQAEAVEYHTHQYLLAYDRLRAEPHTSDGRFLFFFNDESLSYVLHKAAVNHLYKGIRYLTTFQSRLGLLSTVARADLEQCMQTDLDKIGIGLANKNTKEN